MDVCTDTRAFFQAFELWYRTSPAYPRGHLRDIRPQNLLFGLLFHSWATNCAKTIAREDLGISSRFHFRHGESDKFPQIFVCICFRNEHVGQWACTSHNTRLWALRAISEQGRSKFVFQGSLRFVLLRLRHPLGSTHTIENDTLTISMHWQPRDNCPICLFGGGGGRAVLYTWAELMVTHLRWRSPICGFLRFPAKICGFLR